MEDTREDVDGGPEIAGPESGVLSGADAEGDVVRVDWADVDRPVFGLVQAVATATDRDPVQLPPLADVVDGDALELLLAEQGGGDLRMSFSYAGTHVVVDRGEAIEVRPRTT